MNQKFPFYILQKLFSKQDVFVKKFLLSFCNICKEKHQFARFLIKKTFTEFCHLCCYFHIFVKNKKYGNITRHQKKSFKHDLVLFYSRIIELKHKNLTFLSMMTFFRAYSTHFYGYMLHFFSSFLS